MYKMKKVLSNLKFEDYIMSQGLKFEFPLGGKMKGRDQMQMSGWDALEKIIYFNLHHLSGEFMVVSFN